MKVIQNVFRLLRNTLVLAGACVWVGTAYGLGLGSLEIQSNLDQPLDGVIELRLAQGDDLNSIKARLASRDEFDELGIDYPDYVGTVRLVVEERGGSPALRILSDSTINEPFVHLLIRVDWAGGSFLREYTALIDPPIYAAETPAAISQPRVAEAPSTETPTTYTNEDAAVLEQPDTVPSEVFTRAETYTETPVQTEEFVPPPGVEYPSVDQSADLDAQYGPVVAGESLSVIAAELREQFPDLSIYQIMKVMFEENQSAFIRGNINGLLKGSILKIGDINAIRAVEMADARSFYAEQLADWDPGYLVAESGSQGEGDNDSVRVGQDDYSFGDEVASDGYQASEFGDTTSNAASGAADTDTFRVGATNEADSFVSSSQSDSREGEVIALRNQITQLETTLASSSMENQELTERISMLEGQLADLNRLLTLGVDDAELANLESTLASQNNADADTGLQVLDLDAETPAIDDPLMELTDPVESDELQELGDEEATAQQSRIEEVSEPSPQPVKVKSSPGFFGNLVESVADSGIGTMLGGIGALLLGGLGLLIYRRRRADEEFEVSMLSIETATIPQSSPMDENTVNMENSVSQDAHSKHTKETSFLTVYSDTDAVVQADEVDPLAEADVYIAYGRNEQAEEVLLDGIASSPDRIDIKQKLLSLYHKSKNQAGFERIAEELYGQREAISDRDWGNVIAMGQEISPENPLFDNATATAGAALSGAVDNRPQAAAPNKNQKAEEQDDGVAELVKFDDSRSQLSELDEVEINALDTDDTPPTSPPNNQNSKSQGPKSVEPDDDIDLLYDLDDELTLTADAVTYDVDEDEPNQGAGQAQVDENSVLDFDLDDASASRAGKANETPIGDADEISDLEVASSYDEARTQFELAKVFVDLGDEDGAKKILRELAKAEEIDDDVHAEALALLDSIDN